MKYLSVLLILVSGYVSASAQLQSESSVTIKKGSLVTENANGTFTLVKGCYNKYDKSSQKMIESCVDSGH